MPYDYQFACTHFLSVKKTHFVWIISITNQGGKLSFSSDWLIAQTSANYWYQYRSCLRLIICFGGYEKIIFKSKNGILLSKLFWPTVRKNGSSDWEKLIFEIIRTIFPNSERSEQVFVTECFFNLFWRFLISNKLEQLELKLEKIIGIQKSSGKVEKITFSSLKSELSDVNKTYNDISNGQKFEL